ncbi:thiamine phosphate synthase [Brevundimonas sp. VNH65]|uniref:thiamine phosphate synthase n=1 Tax=Brevundimonas sp. VNH65 TaxID=3400917 RepID=UPI003C0F3345
MSVKVQDPAELSDDGRRLWDVAQALDRACPHVSLGPRPPLLFFTDPDRTPEPWIVAGRLPPGSGVVYRHFGRDDARTTAKRLRRVTSDRDVRLLIGLDAPLAEAVAADGVHLPERALPDAPGLRARFPEWMLTGAFHDGPRPPPGVLNALTCLVASPVFASASPSPKRPPLGAGGVQRLTEDLGLPIYALGGVSTETAPRLRHSQACGLAGVEAFARAFA